MYKCTECGTEFEVKPEYCDCGNDEFLLTVGTAVAGVNAEVRENVSVNEDAKVDNAADIKPKNGNPETDLKDEYSKAYISQEPSREQFKLPVHPVVLGLFLFSILLSLYIIFVWSPFSGNIEDAVKTIEEKIEQKDIPSINKLWKETEVKATDNNMKKEVTAKVQEPVKVITASSPKTTAVPAAKQKPVQKTIAKSSQNTSKPQQVKQSSAIVQTNAAEQAKKAQEEAAKKALEAKQKAEAEAIAAAEKAKKQLLSKQELSSYKINLRNEIGKKIDFTRVIGDGDCIVSFKLDSTGKLINRAFAKQSTNITLNNAVYNAVMSTPSFNPPPAAYNNETYRLYIKFTDGNFAVTLE